jgi:hypothetical protein
MLVVVALRVTTLWGGTASLAKEIMVALVVVIIILLVVVVLGMLAVMVEQAEASVAQV